MCSNGDPVQPKINNKFLKNFKKKLFQEYCENFKMSSFLLLVFKEKNWETGKIT